MRNLSREMLIEAFPSSSVTAQLGPRASGFKVRGSPPFETRPYLGRVAAPKRPPRRGKRVDFDLSAGAVRSADRTRDAWRACAPIDHDLSRLSSRLRRKEPRFS